MIRDSRLWRRVQRILVAALELPEVARDNFVLKASGDDEELLASVRFYLERAAGAGEFLSRPLTQQMPYGLKPGTKVGSYLVQGSLGKGGLSTVYEVAHVESCKSVLLALKLARSSLVPASRRCLQNELEILTGLEHPSVVRLVDSGNDNAGRPYIVLNRVNGSRIDDYCLRSDGSLRRTLTVLHRLCMAVAFLHRQGLAHLDIKPSNVLVTSAGRPILLDFGSARYLSRPICGAAPTPYTPQYASPEQFLGSEISVRSDVFALGVLLYRLLLGKGPYASSPRLLSRTYKASVSVALFPLGRALKKRYSPLPLVLPHGEAELVRYLDSISAGALCLRPEGRFASAQELALWLERCLGLFAPLSEAKLRILSKAGAATGLHPELVQES